MDWYIGLAYVKNNLYNELVMHTSLLPTFHESELRHVVEKKF